MRLFIAIPIPDDLRKRLVSMSNGLPGARWVRPEGMHITLFFAGETERLQAEDLDAELSGIRMPAFELQPVGLGSFERGSKVKMVWVGIEDSDALTHLQGCVESAAVRAGFKREARKFKPHITLARMKQGRAKEVGEWIEGKDMFGSKAFPVEYFSLYRSHLAREAALYEPLINYPLN